QVRGQALAFGDDLVRRHNHRGAADHGRARAVGADAEGDTVGIAIDVLNVARIDAELFREHLLERRLVPLALVFAAHRQGRVAARVKADLGEFLARSGGLLDRVGDADTAQLAAGFRLLPALREAGPVRLLEYGFLVGDK